MIIASVVGVAVWFFLANAPSTVAWIMALLFFAYAVLGCAYVLLYIDDWSSETATPHDVTPVPVQVPKLADAGKTQEQVEREMEKSAKAWGFEKH